MELSEPPRRWRRRIFRALRYLGIAFVLAIVIALIDGWRAFGHGADGARRARMERSPNYKNGHFVNPQPLVNDTWGAVTGGAAPDASPHEPVAVDAIDPKMFATAPPTGLRVTWLGHSSILVEIDGHRILTDPVWSNRVSPLDGIGPRRWYPPGIAISDLPPLDAVVISHDHYDHLDWPTIVALNKTGARFIVPLGVGAHLEYWGVPLDHITEVDWWEEIPFGDLRVICVPARHASGRTGIDSDATLWAGYAFTSAKHHVYFSGDTGLFPGMQDIGVKLGPFDLTMIEVGQYDRAWPDWHIGPEQAVIAHQLVRGSVMLPIHWAALQLAFHGWTEPVERALVAGEKKHVQVITPKPGQSFEPGNLPAFTHWWPKLPWHTAEEDPIVSSQQGPGTF